MDFKANWFPLATLAIQGFLILLSVIGLGLNIANYAFAKWTHDCSESEADCI